ncbi:hypothetical protein GUJ93_ZPchr0001g30827 [Zizania palustris]|uniref:Uncharacterized protein n=1 Tax=Zizania palustris TaxID=103762 RepID=A0A8J5RMD4_ZIZPA|nr:hypothetical protein GUJ93_ZPchr0001g30827 [Zizania palustris]
MGRRVDLVTHDYDGALDLGDHATSISLKTIGCTFWARDDNNDNQGRNTVPTTHDTVDAIGSTGANNMDLGGGQCLPSGGAGGLGRAKLWGGVP